LLWSAYALVRFSPEAAGSGLPEVKCILRTSATKWRRFFQLGVEFGSGSDGSGRSKSIEASPLAALAAQACGPVWFVFEVVLSWGIS